MTDIRTCQQIVVEDGQHVTCDRPLHDTALVCRRCVSRLAVALRTAVEHWDDLQAVIARTIRVGAPYRPTTATIEGPACPWCEHPTCSTIRRRNLRLRDEPPIPNEIQLPINLAASEQRYAIGNTITTWTRVVQDATDSQAYTDASDPVPGCLRYLARRANDVAHLEAADEAWSEITYALTALERAIDRPAPVAFAGKCNVCDRALYATAGTAVVRCEPCGIPYETSTKRQEMLDELADRLVRASEAARILPALGTAVTRKDVDKWAHRRLLIAHGSDERGRPLYRVSEVLTLANNPRRAHQRSAR